MGGSILNADRLLQAEVQFSSIFTQALKITDLADPAFERLATDVRVNTKVVKHNWLLDVPGFEPWKDERPIGKVAADGMEITTIKVGNGLEVDEDDLEDDNLGLYEPKIRELAEMAVIYRRERLVQFLINGFTSAFGTAYDGANYFSDAHPNPRFGNQSNLLHATLDDTGALDAAYAKMQNLMNLAGRPANYRPTHLIVGPEYRAAAKAQLESELTTGGATNPTYKLVDLLVSPLIRDYTPIGGIDASNFWFLVDLSRSIKPLVWQIRRDVRFRSVGQRTGESTSYENFLTGKLYFGADMRAEAGYGLWQAAVGSDGTA